MPRFIIYTQIRIWVLMIFSFVLFSSVTQASDIKVLPSDLTQWKEWVIYGMENKLCPTSFNDGEDYRCVWPSRLNFLVNSKEGQFEQEWTVFAKSWVPLPGGSDTWPVQVMENGISIPVVSRDNIPCIQLMPGEHHVNGKFYWHEIPEMIQIPSAVGLISLSINNRPIDFPVLDKNGRLWLQKREDSKKEEDRLDLHIFRLLKDTIPMEITTYLKIDASGQSREIKLDGILLPKTQALSLKSLLPARVSPNGEILFQARPGQWTAQIVSRCEEQVYQIGPVKNKYGQEIWAFEAQNHLRMVKIDGVSAIDPNQADTPSQWKSFPTYIIDSESVIKFEQIRRGDPDPAPDRLNLFRTWWLDFDGKGFTTQDKITGSVSKQWYLAMNQPGLLGRVNVDGEDQLITYHGKEKKSGVELRHGTLNMTADSRFLTSKLNIPVVLWDHDFQTVTGILNLPPGWKLFAAKGVDSLPGTWIYKWTLLDFFIVIIIGIAIYKIKGPLWGIIALFTMTLIYQEPGSPKIIWMHILASLALLKILPEGWMRKTVTFWGIGSILSLLILAIPFMVKQIRCGLYPQLEYTNNYYTNQLTAPIQEASDEEGDSGGGYAAKSRMFDRKSDKLSSLPSKMYEGEKKDFQNRKPPVIKDPNALIQTGPGLPDWSFHSFEMKWNGPVEKSQLMSLWIISPLQNLILAFVRIIFLFILIIGLIDFKYWWHKVNKEIVVTAAVILLFISTQAVKAGDLKSGYPPEEILKELKERILQKPDCLPYCADFLKMNLEANPQNLIIDLEIHAAADTAVPLPGSLEAWIPQTVLIDNKPLKGISKDAEGKLWAFLPQGLHRVLLNGKIDSKSAIQISMPIKPHYAYFKTDGWDIQGIHQDGRVENSIQLTRLKKNAAENTFSSDTAISPFFNIKRAFILGLNWKVNVVVSRLTQADTPVMVSIPLLKGESVTTAGIHVEKGFAWIHMPQGVKEISWLSTLEMSPEISLKAPGSVLWTETWELDASPIWHCELSGIPVIHNQDDSGKWHPTWQPWPGEEVSVKIFRPEAVPGQTITIDSAKFELTPGQRFNKGELTLNIRTSRGGQHKVVLPKDAALQQVKINEKSHPIRQDKQNVVIPLQPGSQKVYLEWHKSNASLILTKSPSINIGSSAVNAKITFNMPQNRWILWAKGPQFGPAVLFWSYVFFVIIASFALGKTRSTPLKTHHWLLLGIGLTQVSSATSVLIVGWLLALGLRKKYIPPLKWFNLIQLSLIGLTLLALEGLYSAIYRGLLGVPNMQIAGNSSDNYHLYWTCDRIDGLMPQPWVLSLPQIVFHILMLLWALWIAFSLLKWLRWGWESFSEGGIWKKITIFKRVKAD